MFEGLSGKQVLVTRAKGQNEKLCQHLRSEGSIPVEFPTIQIIPPQNLKPLINAIAELATYNWLIFTSVNGITYFWQQLIAQEKNAADLQNIHLAAIGPATAALLQSHKLSVDCIPQQHTAEALVDALCRVTGARILIPAADIARNTLAKGLRARGATVDQVVAYHTQPVQAPGNLSTLLPTIDILTFTSPSTAQNLVNLLQPAELADVAANKIIACIGPVTAQSVREAGLPVHILAAKHTVAGLVEALRHYFEQKMTT